MPSVAFNSFAGRQTPESKFSHYAGDIADILPLVSKAMDSGDFTTNKDDTVRTVRLDGAGFFSGVVKLTENMELRSEFSARFPGDTPALSTVALGQDKSPASIVNVICYKHEHLAVKNENETDADWEIICYNASLDSDEPQNPVSMARNYLDLPGGTKTEYTAEEFAKAIMYWSTRAMRG